MTPELRYIMSGASNGFKNMAVDEVLLQECKDGVIDGALRIYGWAPPAVSLGYAQAVGFVDPERCRNLGVDLVRRVTGGGAILHWEEVTYCLVLRREILRGLKWPRQFAGLTSSAVCRALESLGVRASLSEGTTRRFVRRKQVELCFDSGTENEIVAGGRKLAGCAHKFTREAFLSHGSIMTGRAHLRVLGLLRPEVLAMYTSNLSGNSVCLSELLPIVPSTGAVGRELKKGVEDVFGVSLEEGELTNLEQRLSDERARHKRGDVDMRTHGVVLDTRFSE